MSSGNAETTRRAADPQEILEALFGASLDAIQLLAHVVRGENYGPQGQDLRGISAKEQLDSARHLLIHLGPLTEQLRAVADEPSPDIQ